MDRKTLDLRSPDQQALHSKRKPTEARRPRRLHRLYHSENRHERGESERFKCFPYDDLAKRDKINLDIFWLKDESLEDSANLPRPKLSPLRS
jgi:type I restriction enzyme M protein